MEEREESGRGCSSPMMPTKITAFSQNSDDNLHRCSTQTCNDIPLEFICSMDESNNTDIQSDDRQTTFLKEDQELEEEEVEEEEEEEEEEEQEEEEEDCEETMLEKHLLLVHASHCSECQFIKETSVCNISDDPDPSKKYTNGCGYTECGQTGCGSNRCASHRTECQQKYTKRASLKQRFSKPPIPAPISVPSESQTNTNNSFDSGINSSHGTPKSATNSQHMASFDSGDPTHDDCQRMINTPPPVLHHDWKTEVIFPQQNDCNNKCAAGVTVFMALTLFLGIIAFMIVFFATKEHGSTSDTQLLYHSISTSSVLKLNLTYHEEYADPKSQQYRVLRTDMLSMLDGIFLSSTLKEFYVNTIINGFRAGSVYVDVTINLSSLPEALEEEDFSADEQKEWIRKLIQDIVNLGTKDNEVLQSLHAKLEVIFVTNVAFDSVLVYTTETTLTRRVIDVATERIVHTKATTTEDELYAEVRYHELLNQNECGLRQNPFARFRIIGGSPASSGSWPWIGSMDYAVVGHKCAASLIAPQWAITAAHCVILGRDTILQNITFGDISLEDPSPYHQEVPVERIYSHPGFSPLHKDHDVAVLKLARPVRMHEGNVMSVCLEMDDSDWDQYQQCYIAGWGVKEVNSLNISILLQEAQLPLVPKKKCHEQYRISELTYFSVITDNMLCAGAEDGSVDACQSDSGGPLVCKRDDGKWHLVGVTSFGKGCGDPDFSGVYARVTRYRQFISSVVNGEPSVRCEPINLDICRGILPYSHTYATSQKDYQSIIERLRNSINTSASFIRNENISVTDDDYLLFMCSVFLPRCTNNVTPGFDVTTSSQLHPCQEFCYKVENFVKVNNLSWSFLFLSCADFPMAWNESATLCETKKERNVACGVNDRFTISHNTHQVLNSPYYPVPFLNSIDCTWFVTSTVNTYVLIKIRLLQLPECCDVVTIGEGADIYNRTTVRWSLRKGSPLTPKIAYSHMVWLRLQSDGYADTEGIFSFEFHSIDPKDVQDPCKRMRHSHSTVYTSWTCDGIIDCIDGTDEAGCDISNGTTTMDPTTSLV